MLYNNIYVYVRDVCVYEYVCVYMSMCICRISDSFELPKNHYDSLIVRMILPWMSVYMYIYIYTRI